MILGYVEQVKREVAKASRLLWETRTLSASRETYQVVQRVPGEELSGSPAIPARVEDEEVKVTVGGFDGTAYLGKAQGTGRYTKSSSTTRGSPPSSTRTRKRARGLGQRPQALHPSGTCRSPARPS